MSRVRGVRDLTRADKKAWQVLKEGIAKWAPNLRFITLTGVGNQFPQLWRKFKAFIRSQMKEFQYFGVRTNEGLGVIHLVYSGKSVRYGDLKKFWLDMTGFWNVSISKVRNFEGILHEMCRQHHRVRYFHSRYWLGIPNFQVSLDNTPVPERYNEITQKFIKL